MMNIRPPVRIGSAAALLLAGLAALSCWNAGNPLKAGAGTGIVLVHDVVLGGPNMPAAIVNPS